jgi:hypothetical protein
VIEKMISGTGYLFQKNNFKVLEPSAGKGNICDYLINSSFFNRNTIDRLHTIEKDMELRGILQSKGYLVVDSDFLTFESDSMYTLILMNPPFDMATKHFLKAMEIRCGAEVRCLYPTESLTNPYTKERKLVTMLIEDHGGGVKDLGSCFVDSERSTRVEVSLITIPYKEYKGTFNFEGFKKDKPLDYKLEDISNAQVAKLDVYESLVDRYNKTKSVLASVITGLQELSFYSEGLIANNPLEMLSVVVKQATSGGKTDYNKIMEFFMTDLKSNAWKSVLNTTKVQNVLTTKARGNFGKFVENQTYVSFTLENIDHLVSTLYLSQKDIMLSCILEAFDYMTSYHEENRVYFEGWKTNKSWKVTKRVILPRIFSGWSGVLDMPWVEAQKIADIEKAICFIVGKKYEDIDSISKSLNRTEIVLRTCKSKIAPYAEYTVEDKKRVVYEYGTWYDSEFFRVKGFKKQTMHLEFKSEKLYQEFNRIACQGKAWLPPAAKSKG